MNPGFLLALSIMIQLAFSGIMRHYFPGFSRSHLYPYIQVPLSSVLSIFLPSLLYLKKETKGYFTDFLQEVKPNMHLIIASLIGLCLQFIGIIANMPMSMLIEKLSGHLSSSIPHTTSAAYFITSILSFALIPALFEEILFRGIIFNYFRQYGNIPAIVVSGILFALMHFSLANFFGTLILGIVFGIMFAKTNRLIYPVISHFVLNLSACVLTYIANFPLVHDFYNAYAPVFIIISFPMLYLLLRTFVRSAPEKKYTDEEKHNYTKEYMLNITNESSLMVYEHDIRENNIKMAFKELAYSPYFYILIIIYIYLGGGALW